MISKIKALFAGDGTEEQAASEQPKSSTYAELEANIGYVFKNESLLAHALTHKSSVKPEKDPKGLTSNERLEFLGDAVIDCLVTAELYTRYPDSPEGKLSKMKSLLVSRKILGVIADRIDLSKFIIRGRSEKKNRRKGSNTIESNAFEALIGAVYKEAGIDAVSKILQKTLYPSIEFFLNDVENRNYKSRILEMSQKDGRGIPRYPLISEEGPDHDKKFTIAIEVASLQLGIGTGKNKKEAEQDAARIAVKKYPDTTFE